MPSVIGMHKHVNSIMVHPHSIVYCITRPLAYSDQIRKSKEERLSYEQSKVEAWREWMKFVWCRLRDEDGGDKITCIVNIHFPQITTAVDCIIMHAKEHVPHLVRPSTFRMDARTSLQSNAEAHASILGTFMHGSRKHPHVLLFRGSGDDFWNQSCCALSFSVTGNQYRCRIGRA
jgi:hypothetical protein